MSSDQSLTGSVSSFLQLPTELDLSTPQSDLSSSLDTPTTPTGGGKEFSSREVGSSARTITVTASMGTAEGVMLESYAGSRFTFTVDSAELAVIPWEDLKVEPRTIGRGAFGAVYKAEYRHAPVAVKVLKNIRGPKDVQTFVDEISLLSKLRHPCVVFCMGLVAEANIVAVVTEYLDGGDLSGLPLRLQEKNAPQLSVEKQKLLILCDVAKGLAYLHFMGIAHRDVKPRNILLTKDLRNAKLADFGLSGARVITEEGVDGALGGAGTTRYAAPEVLLGAVADDRSDIYSFGVVIYEVLTGQQPFAALEHAMARGMSVYSLPGDLDEGCSALASRMTGLIKSCWARDTTVRPTAAHIVSVVDREVTTVTLRQEGMERMRLAAATTIQAGWRGRQTRAALEAEGCVLPARSAYRKLIGKPVDIPATLPYFDDPYGSDTCELEIRSMRIDYLVCRMTHPTCPDPQLVEIILATHGNFISSRSLLTFLGLRASSDAPVWADAAIFAKRVLPALRLRVLEVVEMWLVKFSYDFEDPELREQLNTFIDSMLDATVEDERPRRKSAALTSTLEALSSKLFHVKRLVTFLQTSSRHSTGYPDSPSSLTESFSVEPAAVVGVLQVRASELANQLTLIDAELFSQLRACDFLRSAWDSVFIKSMRTQRLLAFIERSNDVTRWAQTEVLRTARTATGAMSTPKGLLVLRVHSICRLIDTIEECVKRSNFASAAAITGALQSLVIRRLKHTWSYVPLEHAQKFETLSVAFAPAKDCPGYRNAVDKVPNGPAVPYIGCHLQDLSMLDSSAGDFVGPGRDLVNVHKHNRTHAIIKKVLSLRNVRYTARPVGVIARFLLESERWPDDELNAVSLALEGPNSKRPTGFLGRRISIPDSVPAIPSRPIATTRVEHRRSTEFGGASPPKSGGLARTYSSPVALVPRTFHTFDDPNPAPHDHYDSIELATTPPRPCRPQEPNG